MDVSRAQWRKSSRSGTETNCVEAAAAPGHVAARDSKNSTGPTLTLAAREWAAFTTAVKHGTLNHS